MSPGDQLIDALIGSIGDVFTDFINSIIGVFISSIFAPLIQQLGAALGIVPPA